MATQDAPLSSGTVLAFPFSDDISDLLMERLINDEPRRRERCISEWGDPLDAAILAVLLLKHPVSDIRRRERVATRAGRDAEAGFWRGVARFFVSPAMTRR